MASGYPGCRKLPGDNDVLTGSACRSQVTILAVVPDCQIRLG
jgi:hypothetical protein